MTIAANFYISLLFFYTVGCVGAQNIKLSIMRIGEMKHKKKLNRKHRKMIYR
jgi:hypothetical protein